MTMITCAECGASASDAAKTCPSCGAPAKRMRKKPTPRAVKILVAVVVVALFLVVAIQQRNEPAPTAEDVAADAASKTRNFAAYAAARGLKDHLRDPDSLRFDNIRANEDGSVVCMMYRARNGFGGVNLEHAVTADGITSTSTKRWNKRCAHVEMYDVTAIGITVR